MWKTGGHVCRNVMCEINYWRRVMSEEIWVMLAWCLCTWALFACLLHTVYSHMHDFICMYVCVRVSEERRQKLQHVPPAMFLIITVWVCACTPFFLDVSIMSNLAEKQKQTGKSILNAAYDDSPLLSWRSRQLFNLFCVSRADWIAWKYVGSNLRAARPPLTYRCVS